MKRVSSAPGDGAGRFLFVFWSTNMAWKASLIAAAAALSISLPAAAQPVLTPARGAEISCSVTVTRPVANDEAVITLSLTRQARTAREAQDKLLSAMAPAMRAIRGSVPSSEAEFQTGQLYTNANYSQRKPGEAPKIVSWTSRQSVTVRLSNPSRAGSLIEAATPHFEFSGLSFQVSKGASRQNRRELMADALRELADRASVIARSMNLPASEVKLQKVNFGSTGGPVLYRPVRMMAMAKAEGAANPAPDLAPGQSDVELTASAVFSIGEKPEVRK